MLDGKRTSGHLDPEYHYCGNSAAYSTALEGQRSRGAGEGDRARLSKGSSAVVHSIVRFLPGPQCFYAVLGALAPPARMRELCLYGVGVRLICILDDMTVGAKEGAKRPANAAVPGRLAHPGEARHLVEDMKVRR